jgi:Ca-activated chloride channel family protein
LRIPLLFKTILLTGLLLLPAAGETASLRISQIDASRLLLSQKVSLFVSVTDNEGMALKHLTEDRFNILEAGPDQAFKPVSAVHDFRVGANYKEGVHFLLLLDNSGSMYWTLKGRKTSTIEKTRIYHAKAAVRSLLSNITNPKDRVGLVAYNSFYRRLTPISDQVAVIADQILNDIRKPEKDAWHTEIYGSLILAAREFKTLRRRKAIIILSDGTNSPYYKETGKKHPIFGDKIVSHEESIQALQKAGVSVHVIHFGVGPTDRHLKKIARVTGGVSVHAGGREELETMYRRIMDQIANEYVITYTAPILPTPTRRVKIFLRQEETEVSAERLYTDATILGAHRERFSYGLFIPLLVAILLLYGLTRFKFEKQKKGPSLEVMGKMRRKTATPMCILKEKEIVIGGWQKADLVLGGLSDVLDRHANITFDRESKEYTLKARGDLTVNNRRLTEKTLVSGDVIKIDEAIIVFDAGSKMAE